MNARQKAKKYKKELEQIKYMISPYNVTTLSEEKRIMTLKAVYVENYDHYILSSALSKQAIIDHLYSCITKDISLKDEISITTEIDESTGDIRYTATLQVLRLSK